MIDCDPKKYNQASRICVSEKENVICLITYFKNQADIPTSKLAFFSTFILQ